MPSNIWKISNYWGLVAARWLFLSFPNNRKLFGMPISVLAVIIRSTMEKADNSFSVLRSLNQEEPHPDPRDYLWVMIKRCWTLSWKLSKHSPLHPTSTTLPDTRVRAMWLVLPTYCDPTHFLHLSLSVLSLCALCWCVITSCGNYELWYCPTCLQFLPCFTICWVLSFMLRFIGNCLCSGTNRYKELYFS